MARITRLMADLLEYGNPGSASAHPTLLADVVEESIALCAPLAGAAGVALERRLAPGLPPVMIDGRRLIRVLQNLIDNAVRHSAAGATVTIEVDDFDENRRRWVACRVLDSGSGFAAEDLPRIFEPYYSRRRGGTGLGLCIARRLVQDDGGTLVAENRADGGAIMRLQLPALDGV